MTSNIHPIIALSLRAFAPPQSEVHQLAAEAESAEQRAEERRIDRQQTYLRATKQDSDFPRDFNTVEARL